MTAVREKTSTSALARELRKTSAPVERVLWGLLRNRRLEGLKFRRQVPIGPYIVDFVCLRYRLVIEIDGLTHINPENDQRRDAWLTAHGYHVMRFPNADVWKDKQLVLSSICDKVALISKTGHYPQGRLR